MPKTVAIWAPLRYANYGDDMQAIAFAQLICSMGYQVKLFQLDETLSKMYDLPSVHTVDELCQNVNLCIIAGGALLTPFRWYKRILNKTAREYEADFKDLYKATLKYKNVNFCAISMGGDGIVKNPRKWYSRWRCNFFKSKSFINGTVRLEGDVLQMKQSFGKNFQYFPDMLFKSGDYFTPQKLKETKKYRVGFNLKKGKYLDKKLISDIMRYAESHDDMEFHFTTTHLQKIGLNYQYVPQYASKNIFIDRYESPSQLLGVLASMDCFVTSMLHVGLTGLTMKTPFVSYRGPGKTKSFLKSIGGEWAILPENTTFEYLKQNIFSYSKKELYAKYNVLEIEKMKMESAKQYEYCKMIVGKNA